MHKTKLLLLFYLTISLNVYSQIISYTSIPVSTRIGNNLVFSYKYTATTPGQIKFIVTKNGGVNATDVISTVASTSSPSIIGTDVTGTFTVALPSNLVPTKSLTGNESYRFKLELYNICNKIDYSDNSVTRYNFFKGQIIDITSLSTSTQVGTNIVVNYKYTLDAPGRIKINITRNGGTTPSTFISTVAFSVINPAAAGIDLTGTFNLPIPANTIPTSSLTGNENYRIRLELFTAADTWITGDYTKTNYNFLSNNLDTNENNIIDDVMIYPNPVENILNIINLSNVSVVIFNVYGKIVFNSKVSNNVVNVSSLNTGTYIMALSSDEGNKKIKFIKN